MSFKNKWVARLLALAVALALLPGVLIVAYGVVARYHHAQQTLTKAQLQQSHEAAVRWMTDHEGAVLEDPNSALWYMVREAATITGDPRLMSLVQRYLEIWFPADRYQHGWRNAFAPASQEPVDLEQLASAQKYQQFLMYSVTCDPRLLSWPSVQEHLGSGACPITVLSALKESACSSHQLMGLNWLKERKCQPPGIDLQKSIDQTRADVRQLLWLDFRVRDVYLQRALTLWSGGYRQDVPSDVLSRIVGAQLPDGGWGDQHVMLDRPFYLAMGGRKGLTTSPGDSDFHATAQGLLLTALAVRDWGQP